MSIRKFILPTLRNLAALSLACGLALAVVCCSTQAKTAAADDHFVHALTAGVISIADPIRIEFVDRIQGMLDDKVFFAKALRFEPAIAGSLAWQSDNVLVFKPAAALPRLASYRVFFDASALKGLVASARDFDFRFSVSGQSLDLKLGALSGGESQSVAGQSGVFELSGTVSSRDIEDPSALEKTLAISAEGQAPLVTWTHGSDGRSHQFHLAGISRGDRERSLIINLDGSRVGAQQRETRKLAIPAMDSFSVMAVQPVQGDENYVDLAFSDPVDSSQDLHGLIRYRDSSGKAGKLSYTVQGSRVKVYQSAQWPRLGTLEIDGAIRSGKHRQLVAGQSVSVSFSSQKPAVRFAGTGVILPTTQGLTLPIESMNLKYVMVEATRVYHANIPQFLQVNNLAGTRELYRVGKVVWRQVVDMGWKAGNQDKWVRYGLDLGKLLAANPDGLFRIRLTFRQPHVVWNDATGTGSPTAVTWGEAKTTQDPDNGEETSYWDYYGNEETLQYDQRDNPADPAYYHEWYDHKIEATRSVMVSDIGLMAKRGTDGSLTVVANDLRSTQPLTGLDLSVLDFTMQPLAKAATDNQGMAHFSSFAEPAFFVVAKAANQYGYLKLGDSDALSVSSFDVAGEKVERGIKGFVYGERGVWRPGDTMYLNFLMIDPLKTLPVNHPVMLELYTPQNHLFGSWTKTGGLNGFYHFPVGTQENSPTGTWLARVRVGGRTWEKPLKVETVVPNRLKIDFGLLDSPNGIVGGSIHARLGAQWLTGIKAPGFKSTVQVSYSATETSFSGHPELKGFAFDDPTRPFSSEKQTIFDANLDQDGNADIESDLQLESAAPGKLRANFDIRVFEPGGAFSSDAFSVDAHPYNQYVGIKAPAGDIARGMLLTDVDHPLKIVMVDPTGAPVKGKSSVRAEIYQIGWRWWWESGEDAQTMAEYVSNKSLRPVKSDTVNLTDGSGEWKFRVAYPAWGRFLIRVTDLNGNHSSGIIKYIDWPGWAGRSQKDGPGGASVLQLATDKPSYNVGEKVSVSIPGNAKGRALVSLERSGRIIREEWLQPTGASTVYSFVATPEMSPNIYLHVTFLQPHLQTANDVPIRTYGVVPVLVENPDSHLHPQILCDDTFKPGAKVSIKIKESSGQAMTYTLALVDEGLLSLTRFKTPDAWGEFYKREASLVHSWDLYDFVAGAFAGQLENLLAIGGGDEGVGAGRKKADRFPPLVRFVAPVSLAAGATNEHIIELPEYVGAVRVMVVAAQQSGAFPAYGLSDKSVTVKKEVMVVATLPRVLSPGEEADLPVSLFYLGGGARDIPLKLEVGGALVLASPGSKTVKFKDSGEQIVSFRVRAKDKAGIGTVRISATGATDSTFQTIELNVRLPATPITLASAPGGDKDQAPGSGGAVLAGQSWSLANVALPGFTGSNSARIELSVMPPINLESRLDYLVQYPHGCIEQTTSGVFPQLYLASFIDLDAKRQAEIQKNLSAGIARIAEFATPTGGFSYWPGETSAVNAWGTNYAGHFLLEAKRAGLAVPATLLANWRTYQLQAANSWNDQSIPGKIDQAYRLYTLALDGAVDLASLNRLKELVLPEQARWRLAAAYVLVGQTAVARKLVENSGTTMRKYREMGTTFGSDLRDKAMILESMALLDMNAQSLPLARDIAAELSKNQWLSTQETAYSLLALSRIVGLMAGNGQIKASVSWKDSDGTAFKKTLTSGKPLLVADLPLGANAISANLEVKNEGSGPLFPRLLLTGTPTPGSEKAYSNGLRMKVRYLNEKGDDFANLDNLAPGSDVYVEVTVQNLNITQKYEQLALSHLFPSGFEIINDRMQAAGQDAASGQGDGKAANSVANSLLPGWMSKNSKVDMAFDYRDIRDDRVYTYFSMPPLSQKLFRMHANASYRGRFYLPSIKVEAMYDGSISALVPGFWLGIGEKAIGK